MKFKHKESDRNKQEQTGKDRKRQEQTGTDGNRQEQTVSDRIRQEYTGLYLYRKVLHHNYCIMKKFIHQIGYPEERNIQE